MTRSAHSSPSAEKPRDRFICQSSTGRRGASLPCAGDVLFVTPSYVPFIGGAQAFQKAMVERLVAEHWSVTLLTTDARQATDFWHPPDSGTEPLPTREALAGVEVERLRLAYPWLAPYTLGLIRRAGYGVHDSRLPPAIQRPFLRWLSNWTPPLFDAESVLAELVREVDLVQVIDSSWDGLFVRAALAAARYRKPLVSIPLMHLGDPRVAAHFQMVHQVDVYRASDAVLALSEREATVLAELGVPSDRIHVVQMGVDPQWRCQSGDPAQFRERYGLSDPVVAFVGAHTYDKGLFTLVQAIVRLNQHGTRVHLVCAGPGGEQLRESFRGQPQRVRAVLHDRVKVLGTVSEHMKHELLAACDVLALPSRVDTFGIVLVEAGLHGKPVIGADAGGIPGVIEQGVTGLLVPFDDPCALADAIRRVVTDPRLAARLGDAGHHSVLSRYTWDHTYRSLKEIYLDILWAPRGITCALP